MGGNLVPGGATFRTWAPNALAAALVSGSDLATAGSPGWQPPGSSSLVRQPDDTWTGFFPGFADGSPYRFWVQGPGSSGFKRDPYARELDAGQPLADSDCLLRDPAEYPWNDAGFSPPPFNEVILYQLHVGTFYAVDANGQDKRASVAKFLDVQHRSALTDPGISVQHQHGLQRNRLLLA
jgi:1,4-alpha-glucan branching enzyme